MHMRIHTHKHTNNTGSTDKELERVLLQMSEQAYQEKVCLLALCSSWLYECCVKMSKQAFDK